MSSAPPVEASSHYGPPPMICVPLSAAPLTPTPTMAPSCPESFPGHMDSSKGTEGCSPIISTVSLTQDWVGTWHKHLFRAEGSPAWCASHVSQ